MPPDPPRKLAPLALEKAAAYFPSGDIYCKTYWQPWLSSLLCLETDRSIRIGKQDYVFILTDFKK